MRKAFVCVLALLCISAVAFGSDAAPAVTASDFASSTDSAGWFWEMLAGFGTAGVIVAAIAKVLWTYGKPYLDVWMEEKKLSMLWDAVTTGVVGMLQTYVDDCKRNSPDGKLTEAEKEHAFKAAKDYAIAYMASQGVDIIRHYGDVVIDLMIEAILARLKLQIPLAAKVVDMVAGPLPELQP